MNIEEQHLERVIDIPAGVVMVVTDLHGDWELYRRYRDHFLTLHARGQADYLLFTGDLIHSEGPPQTDRSLDIVLDILALREELSERLIYLMGNHELPHLYGIILAKGDNVYTPRFEAALGAHRPAVTALFQSLPFYARTRAGVSLCHAGAAAELSIPGAATRLFRYSHQVMREALDAALPEARRAILRKELAHMNNMPYEALVRRKLAVSGAQDPRYDDLLIGVATDLSPDFQLLWSALFNRNEIEYGLQDYAIFVDALLRELSAGYHPQEVLVTGHIPCRGGYTVVAGRQLRLASGPHAQPHAAAGFLCFDAARPLREADALREGLNLAQLI